MNEWFYAKNGQQVGPVTMEQLRELARSGGLDPKDLVWTSSMKDWTPAGQVEGLFGSPTSVAAPAADPSNPYAAPQSTWSEPPPSSVTALPEIIPGSEPIDPTACVKRGFDLTKRQFGNILLVGVVYFAVSMGVSMMAGLVQGILGVTVGQGSDTAEGARSVALGVNILAQIVTQIISLYLGLGLTRVGLNLVSGQQVTPGMLFGQGHKLMRAIGASIVFWVMFVLGLLLLVVPGIYVALRYGQYMNAIVDRDMKVMEAFSYSSAITTNNKLQILVLWILCILVVLAGFIACGIGLIFAGPVAWLASMTAYRWMQYGHRSTLDHPNTQTPLLAGQ